MVGIHVPFGGVRYEHVPDGQGAAVGVFPGVGNGRFDFFKLVVMFPKVDVRQILSLCVVVLWIVVSIGTLRGVVSGRLFFAPCLGDLKAREDENKDGTKAA